MDIISRRVLLKEKFQVFNGLESFLALQYYVLLYLKMI